MYVDFCWALFSLTDRQNKKKKGGVCVGVFYDSVQDNSEPTNNIIHIDSPWF